MGIVVVILISMGFSAAIGYAIGHHKGRTTEGLVYGAFLGFIGWIIVAVMPPSVQVEAERHRALAAATARPGWFPDPYGQTAQRWWDGTRWTNHTA